MNRPDGMGNPRTQKEKKKGEGTQGPKRKKEKKREGTQGPKKKKEKKKGRDPRTPKEKTKKRGKKDPRNFMFTTFLVT